MAELIEYAQMALNVYAASVRNKVDIPAENGWTRIDWQPDQFWNMGFSAGAFQKGNEIVIVYTGTNDAGDKLNWLIGLGAPASQVIDAVDYYLKIKAAHPEATITFTGHSLGGGLASLMAVFFDLKATTFDEAPFQLAALNPAVIAEVGVLLATRLANEPAFVTYAASAGLLALSREYNVTHYAIEGEALGYPRLSPLTLVGADHLVPKGSSTADAVQLHSMTLLTAALASPNFHEVMKQLPSLVEKMMDNNLFGADAQNEDKIDILRHLLRHQFGADGVTKDDMLDRFGVDFYALARFGPEAADSAIAKAVMGVGLQHYYQQDTTREQFFKQIAGGVQFDLTKPLGDEDTEPGSILGYEKLLEAARPMAPWETTAPGYIQPWEALNTFTESKVRWNVALTEKGLSGSTEGSIADLVLGGESADRFDAGAGDDLLIGGVGSDTLKGGEGDDILYGGNDSDVLSGDIGTDILMGGEGADTYRFQSGDGADTILDADGGLITRNGSGLSAGTVVLSKNQQWQSEDGQITYTKNGQNLHIAFLDGQGDAITIKNFDFNAALGVAALTAKQAVLQTAGAKSFGIRLAPHNNVVIAATADQTENLSRLIGYAADPADLEEGGTVTLTAFVSEAADHDRSLVFKLAGGSDYKLCTGADFLDFNSGEIRLDLPAGKTALTFALVTSGDIDAAAALQLTATLDDPAAPSGADAIAGSLAVNVAATEEPAADDRPVIQSTPDNGDWLINEGAAPGIEEPSNQAGGPVRFVGGDRGDSVIRGYSSDIVEAGGGDDLILYIGGQGGSLKGEEGGDLIDAGTRHGGKTVYVWTGGDQGGESRYIFPEVGEHGRILAALYDTEYHPGQVDIDNTGETLTVKLEGDPDGYSWVKQADGSLKLDARPTLKSASGTEMGRKDENGNPIPIDYSYDADTRKSQLTYRFSDGHTSTVEGVWNTNEPLPVAADPDGTPTLTLDGGVGDDAVWGALKCRRWWDGDTVAKVVCRNVQAKIRKVSAGRATNDANWRAAA